MLAFSAMVTSKEVRNKVALIGASTWHGQEKVGTQLAPGWLRLKGLIDILKNNFYSVKDMGDVTSHDELFNDLPLSMQLLTVSEFNHRLQARALEALMDGYMALNIGGDHSCAIGTIAASLKIDPNVKIIWVDAHADINTPDTSPTQNIHGMPLAVLSRIIDHPEYEKHFSWLGETLNLKNIAYIGLRDVDAGEQEFLNKFGIKNFTADEVKSLGIENVMDSVLGYLDPDHQSNFHLSFDVDGIDPKWFPSTGTPVNKGLSLDDGRHIIERVFRTKRVISTDIVEVNPQIGPLENVEKTLESFNELIKAIPDWREVWQQNNSKDFKTYSDIQSLQ